MRNVALTPVEFTEMLGLNRRIIVDDDDSDFTRLTRLVDRLTIDRYALTEYEIHEYLFLSGCQIQGMKLIDRKVSDRLSDLNELYFAENDTGGSALEAARDIVRDLGR